MPPAARARSHPHTRPAPSRAALGLALAGLLLAGCGSFGTPKPQPVADPNANPTNYKERIARYLVGILTDRADYLGARIAAPALKSVEQSERYVVCVEFNGHNERKERVAVFLSDSITQFIRSEPAQCAGVVYEPFKELAAELPPT